MGGMTTPANDPAGHQGQPATHPQFAEPTPAQSAEPAEAEPLGAEAQELVNQLFNLARRAGRESAQLLDKYLTAGIPVDLTNQDGNTLLMLAAYNGNVEGLEVLIHHGADVDRLNDRGQSPLAGAVFKKEDDVVRMLLDHGADPNAGRPSAIDTARMFERVDLLEWFGGK